MCSKNELFDDLQDQLIPKKETIDVDFIKMEEFEEEYFVAPEKKEQFKVEKDLVKEEIDLNEVVEKYSSSNV